MAPAHAEARRLRTRPCGAEADILAPPPSAWPYRRSVVWLATAVGALRTSLIFVGATDHLPWALQWEAAWWAVFGAVGIAPLAWPHSRLARHVWGATICALATGWASALVWAALMATEPSTQAALASQAPVYVLLGFLGYANAYE